MSTADQKDPPPATDSLPAVISEAQQAIVAFLAGDGSREGSSSSPSPELLRVWGRIHKGIEDVRRFSNGLKSPYDASLRDLLKQRPRRDGNVDAPWAVAEQLDILLPQLADEAYVSTLLDAEAASDSASRPPPNAPRPLWRESLDSKDLGRLRTEYRKRGQGGVKPEIRDQAVAALVFLRQQRSESSRLWRQRMSTRRRYFRYAFLAVAPMVVGFSATLVIAGNVSWRLVVLTSFAGAVGGTVAGILQLRKLKEITQLRLFGPGLSVQPFLGAAAALFALLLLESPILSLPGATGGQASWAAAGVYGFLAGYSEPFFLGLVGRLARKAEGDEEPSLEPAEVTPLSTVGNGFPPVAVPGRSGRESSGGSLSDQEEVSMMEGREGSQATEEEGFAQEEMPEEDIPEPDPEDESVATEEEDDDPESLMGEGVAG